MNNRQETAFQGKKTKPFDSVQFFSHNKKKILTRFFVILMVTVPLLFALMRTSYEAQGVLQVAPSAPTLLGGEDSYAALRDYGTYVTTQVSRLKQHELLMSALNRLPPTIKDLFVGEDETLLDAAVELAETLTVQQVPRTHLIALSLRHNKPDGLAEMINSILTVYLEKLQEEEQGMDNRLLTYLKKEKKKTEKEIAELEHNIGTLALELGVSSFEMAGSHVQNRHQIIQEHYLEAKTRTLQAQKAADGLVKKREVLESMPIEQLVLEELNRSGGYEENRTFAERTVQQLKASLETLAEDNPTYHKISSRIAEVQSEFDSLEKSLGEEAEELVRGRIIFQNERELIEANNQLEVYGAITLDLETKMQEASQELFMHSQKIMQGLRMSEVLNIRQALEQSLEQRVYRLTVEGKAPGRTTIEGIARAISHSNMKKIALISVFGSFFLSIGLSLLGTVFHNTVNSKTDATNAVGSPPSWPIPYEGKRKDRLATCFSKTTLEDPECTASKSIQSLAVKLDKDRRNNNSSVALFTGVGRKAGTTRIVLNCAHAMRQTCNRVLIIDLNRQNPALATFAIDRTSASKSGLKGVAYDPERQVDILANGDGFDSLQMSRQEILTTLKKAKDEYDFVLIDSAPLHSSDLTEFLSAQCDVVVPIVCGNYSKYRESYEAIQILLRGQVLAIAPVLNWRFPSDRAAKRNRLRYLPRWLRRFILRRRVRKQEKLRRRELEPAEEPLDQEQES